MQTYRMNEKIRYWLKIIATHFLAGGGSLTVVFFFIFGQIDSVSEFAWSWLVNGSLWVALGVGNGMLVDWLDTHVSWLDAPVKRFIYSVILMFVYTILAAVIVFLILACLRFGVNPVQAFRWIDTGFLISVISVTVVVSFFLHGRGFLLSWRQAAVEAEQHKRMALASQYESLKNQVNPHFLFNSLNVLSTLVYKDQDTAAKFIKQLSKVYRYVLDTRDQEVVPLSTELKALEAYIFLVKIRFGENLHFDLQVRPETDMVVAPLTLQMLVENAVKHNIVSKNTPLHIGIQQTEEYLTVWNNLQLKSNQQDSVGVGLPNIKARYQMLTDKPLEINETEDRFEVMVPIIKMEIN